jgi:threonine aldolase
MFFASDNWTGASAKVMQALAHVAASPPQAAYGQDEHTARATHLVREVFEAPDAQVFFLASGTAANAMALAHITPPWGGVFCHREAHINGSECGAAEFYGGLKLIGLPGIGAKLTHETLDEAVGRLRIGDAHSSQPGTLSITNLTECGLVYDAGEVAELSAVARRHGMAVHMDGARFANAVASLNQTPANLTWRAGVDVLSLGATKNGALIAEALVVFDPARASGLGYRRMRAGHLISKHRVIAAQFEAWLGDGHWLDLARHANAMAAKLAEGFAKAGVALAWTPAGNEVFPALTPEQDARLKAAGALYYPWPAAEPAHPLPAGTTVMRFVTSFQTSEEEVAGMLRAIA